MGSLPVSSLVSVGDFILFAAKTWRIDEVDDTSKSIYVTRHKTGKVPPFNSSGGWVHDKVRQRMRELYESTQTIPYLDAEASQLLTEGRNAYQRMVLNHNLFIRMGSTNTLLFTWLGDGVNQTIAAMLKRIDITALAYGPALEIYAPELKIVNYLKQVAAQPLPSADNLLYDEHNIMREKWDWLLPDSLLKKSFASSQLDIETAHQWLITQFK